jgi:hypothetical protein
LGCYGLINHFDNYGHAHDDTGLFHKVVSCRVS